MMEKFVSPIMGGHRKKQPSDANCHDLGGANRTLQAVIEAAGQVRLIDVPVQTLRTASE